MAVINLDLIDSFSMVENTPNPSTLEASDGQKSFLKQWNVDNKDHMTSLVSDQSRTVPYRSNIKRNLERDHTSHGSPLTIVTLFSNTRMVVSASIPIRTPTADKVTTNLRLGHVALDVSSSSSCDVTVQVTFPIHLGRFYHNSI